MTDPLLSPTFVPVGAGPRSPATPAAAATDFLPVITQKKIAQDAEKVENIELRAYKLGKKRWLYNECRLTLTAQSGFMPALEILESSRQGEESIPAPINECGVKYLLKLRKNLRIELEVYVAFDSPVQVEQEGSHLSPSLEPPCMGYKWPPVLRKHCQKGCNGAILRSIQRYGRISRRTNKKQSPEAEVEDRAKDPRFLYLSIDEASTHVGGKRFRLIAAAFEAEEESKEGDQLPKAERKFLGSGVSLPITVLANNDAPNGPATIDLDIALSDHWLGWSILGEPDDPHYRNNSGESLQREHFPLDSPEGPSSMLSGTASRLLLGLPSFGRGSTRAQTDLQYIRERALMSTEDDDALAYDGDTPAAKRSRNFAEPDYGNMLYARMETAPAQLLSSGLSSSLASSFFTPDRGLTTEASTTGIGSLDSNQPHLNEVEASPLRHHSVSDSTALRMIRHNSLPSHMPDLSVLQHSLRSITDPALQQHGLSTPAPFRYNSMPFQSSLLSELQAQTQLLPLVETRESLMWAGLQNPQRLPPQQSAIRQESSPVNMVSARETDSFPWNTPTNRQRVQQVQNPGLSALGGQITNPFALHGRPSRDDQFWGSQYRVPQPSRPRNASTKDTPETEDE